MTIQIPQEIFIAFTTAMGILAGILIMYKWGLHQTGCSFICPRWISIPYNIIFILTMGMMGSCVQYADAGWLIGLAGLSLGGPLRVPAVKIITRIWDKLEKPVYPKQLQPLSSFFKGSK